MTATPLSASSLLSAETPETRHAHIGGWELLRCRLTARLSRLFRREFWPAWTTYLPLLPYLAWLALRYRGITTCTLANPGIPCGGLVGESKWDVLRLLPHDAIVPTTMVEPAPLAQRVAVLEAAVRAQGWSWPIILKPDVGERGTGVSLIQNLREARRSLESQPGPVLAQAYHPGPHEAGVFYIRMPGEASGRIFSITDKRFPVVTGDGRSSIRSLVWRHPRYRLQADVFLTGAASEADRVPAKGEQVRLGFLGNHCRGSMFLDGASLITPELTAAVDAIALRTPGFHFGRFDVRYGSIDGFKAGRDFRIVELNGLLSESTNIYDPSLGFFRAQAILRRQWRWAYRIGRAVRDQGATPPTLKEVLAVFRAHAKRGRPSTSKIPNSKLSATPHTMARDPAKMPPEELEPSTR